MRLRPVQALALYEIGTYGGLLGPIGVGRGKELICFLAGYVLGATHPLLLMPAHLIARSRGEMHTYAQHWRIVVPRLLSFQMLGQASHAGDLALVPPDAIIVNEAHFLKNPRAAVTRRYRRHLKDHPNTHVVNVSGTLLTKSLMDFGPLVRHCVKPSPVPTNDRTLQEWADVVDEKSGYGVRDPGALSVLCNPEEAVSGTPGVRRALRRRLTETAGVIASGEDDVTVDGEPVRLVVRPVEYRQDPAVETHYETLREEWETPDGWAFDQAMGVWSHARELALGFHYTFATWPPGSARGGVKGPWMLARTAWCKYVRESIRSSKVHDSPSQIETACSKAPRPPAEYVTWRDIRPSFTPVSKAEWHCTGALEACEAWAKDGGGVIWTDHRVFALELARRTGLRYFGQGGTDVSGRPIEKAPATEVVIASRHANATGRNIQHWSRCLVTAAPMNAKDWEQLLGRFHRTGQKSPVVTVDVLLGCREHFDGWTRSLALADMTRDMLGAPQKILLATSEFPEGVSDRVGYAWEETGDTDTGSLRA